MFKNILFNQAFSSAEEVITQVAQHNAEVDVGLLREAMENCRMSGESANLDEGETELAMVAVAVFFGGLQKRPTEENGESARSLLLAGLNLAPVQYEKISGALNALRGSTPKDQFEEVVCDAIHSVLTPGDINRFFEQELLLRQVIAGQRTGWLRLIRQQLNQLEFFTPYGKAGLSAARDRLLGYLDLLHQDIDKEARKALMQELNLSKKEFKRLKKLGKRDDRGVQTLLRLTSRNHFTLNAMVDRKANIMISINTIILSIMIGGFIRDWSGILDLHLLPVSLLILSSVLSVTFAVISIRPEVSHGKFSREELRAKKGNLLFYGNFLKVPLKDFESEMLQLLNDQSYLYLSMIRDIYFLGQTLNKKNLMLRLSLNIFMFGIVLAVVLFAVTSFT